MLGIILLYFIGKKFYELADDYHKSKWVFAILGVVIYYVGAFIVGLIIGVFELIIETNFIETANKFVLALIELPFGILSCYVLYSYLEKRWKKEKPLINDLISKIGNKEQ